MKSTLEAPTFCAFPRNDAELAKQSLFFGPVTYQRACTLDTTRSYMSSTLSFLAKGEDTGGRFALMEARTERGTEPPAHIHEWEHETIYVLEGEVELYCAGQILTAGAGEIVFVPQGQPHAFYIRSAHLHALVMMQAAGEHAVGLDRYFISMGEPAKGMELPVDAVTYAKDDPSHAARVAAEHGLLMLSPEETARALPHFPGFGANPAMFRDVAEHSSSK